VINMSMKIITLTMLDYDGISDLVTEAKANGAVAANIPGDPDNFTLTFEKDAAASAFLKAVEKHKSANDAVEEPSVDEADVSPNKD
jgi:hypothetical protein